jgi:hypothetical protein
MPSIKGKTVIVSNPEDCAALMKASLEAKGRKAKARYLAARRR